MASTLFQNSRKTPSIRDILTNPQGVYNDLYANNPQFKQFIDNNKGKTPEQIAFENGVNLADLNKLR